VFLKTKSAAKTT